MPKCKICGHQTVVDSMMDDHNCWEHDIDCGEDDE